MPTVNVVSAANARIGSVDLDPRVFGVRVRQNVVHEVLVMQQASKRQGTAATKEKGQVRGGGKKPWKQKGTGRARAGSNRSPLWRGGGTVFGPHPRRYGYRLPRRKSRLALQGVLSAKAAAGEVVVLDQLLVEPPKAKTMAALIKGLGLTGKVLVAVGQPSDGLQSSTRNLPGVLVLSVAGLNLHDLLRHRYIVTTQGDLPVWSECWA